MLSILITHHKTPILLKLCLKSIMENIGQIKHEIIVLDSESQKETKDLIEENFPKVKLISFLGNVGYAYLVNAGIRKAKGDYLLILNADIIILKDAVLKMIDFMESNPGAGIVGPQLLTFSNQHQDSCFNFPTLGAILARRTFLGKLSWGKEKITQFLIKDKDMFTPRRVDWLQGSAMLARKEAVDRVGPMDERFFIYLEDADWCRRFWQNSYEVVYLPTAQMAHYYYRLSKKWGAFLDIFINKYSRLHLISAFKYFRKWRSSSALR